jgi:hypothetical protein
MRLPKPPRNFDDLFDRIIFEQDGNSTIGNAMSKFGTSVSDTMKKAYNLTADNIGLGASLSNAIPQEHKTFYAEYNIPSDESEVFELLMKQYSTDDDCINEIKLKSLRLSSGESVNFNLLDWDRDKRLTFKTLVLNKNDALLKDQKVFQTFYTKFAQTDMSNFKIDPLFLLNLDEVLDIFFNSKTPTTTTPATNTNQNNDAEKNNLKNSVLTYFKKILKGKKNGTYKDSYLHIRVFLAFVYVQKGSQLF